MCGKSPSDEIVMISSMIGTKKNSKATETTVMELV